MPLFEEGKAYCYAHVSTSVSYTFAHHDILHQVEVTIIIPAQRVAIGI